MVKISGTPRKLLPTFVINFTTYSIINKTSFSNNQLLVILINKTMFIKLLHYHYYSYTEKLFFLLIEKKDFSTTNIKIIKHIEIVMLSLKNENFKYCQWSMKACNP